MGGSAFASPRLIAPQSTMPIALLIWAINSREGRRNSFSSPSRRKIDACSRTMEFIQLKSIFALASRQILSDWLTCCLIPGSIQGPAGGASGGSGMIAQDSRADRR